MGPGRVNESGYDEEPAHLAVSRSSIMIMGPEQRSRESSTMAIAPHATGPSRKAPVATVCDPIDSFARDRGISPQTAKHEKDREHTLPILPPPSAEPAVRSRVHWGVIAIPMPTSAFGQVRPAGNTNFE